MIKTKKQAKKICLEVWEYLALHSEIGSKFGLPPKILKKIGDMISLCPLCDYFFNYDYDCMVCPLYKASRTTECYYYSKWQGARNDKLRKKWADKIVELVKAW